MQEPESTVQECPDKTAPTQERVDQNETEMHSSVLATHELSLGEVSRLTRSAGETTVTDRLRDAEQRS